MVEQIGVIALTEHLRGKEQHGSDGDRHKRAALQKRLDDLHRLTLLFRCGLRGDALLAPAVAEEVEQHRQHGDDDHADQGDRRAHDLDRVAFCIQQGIAARILCGYIAERCEQHRGHCAERGADRTEHGQRRAFLIIRGNDLCHRAVGDVDAGIEHAEQDVGHIDPCDLRGARESLHGKEHQNRRNRGGYGKDSQPMPVTSVGADLRAVDHTSPDRVVDRVPDAGDDGHDHDVQHADIQDVRVELVQNALRQTEHETAREIAERVAELVLHPDPARAGNVRLHFVSLRCY